MPRDWHKLMGWDGEVPPSGLDPLRPRRRPAASEEEMAETARCQFNMVALHDRIFEAEEELLGLDHIEARREKAREIDALRAALAEEIAKLRALG